MKLGKQVGLGHGHIVLDGDPAPLPKGERSRQFSAHICCGQTAGWIKMPLGTEEGLGPGDFVLDGDLAPVPKNGANPFPNFRPMSIVAKRLDGQDGTWPRGGPWSRLHCARLGPSSPPQKGGGAPPNFRPISIVAKRLDACHSVWR